MDSVIFGQQVFELSPRMNLATQKYQEKNQRAYDVHQVLQVASSIIFQESHLFQFEPFVQNNETITYLRDLHAQGLRALYYLVAAAAFLHR